MNLVIAGSTGSIGRQTLDICHRFPDRLTVLGLGGGWNSELLERQIREFRPRYVASAGRISPELLRAVGAETVSLEELAGLAEADRVMLATSGRLGLEPALAALRAGNDVVVANKEVLVMAGALVTSLAAETGARLIPVDSEHSAIWQSLRGDVADERNAVEVGRVLLTASGGAFRDLGVDELAEVTVDEALRHPTWVMGPKVTIDSATLMNKGFEVIETHWLFGVDYDRVEIVMHRESLVHSMVEFVDGSIKAQLGPPDMRLPIQFALSWPERWENPALPRMQFAQAFEMHFAPPNLARYPCLRLALEAARAGGTYTTVLSAADEFAVNRFLGHQAKFTDIPVIVERALEAHGNSARAADSLEAVLDAEHETLRFLEGLVAA